MYKQNISIYIYKSKQCTKAMREQNMPLIPSEWLCVHGTYGVPTVLHILELNLSWIKLLAAAAALEVCVCLRCLNLQMEFLS